MTMHHEMTQQEVELEYRGYMQHLDRLERQAIIDEDRARVAEICEIMLGNLYGYFTQPIDFGWNFLSPCKDSGQVIVTEVGSEKSRNFVSPLIGIFYPRALALAKHLGCEGGTRVPPQFFFTPDEQRIYPGVAIKDDNNGNTFLISTIPLWNLTMRKCPPIWKIAFIGEDELYLDHLLAGPVPDNSIELERLEESFNPLAF